MYVRLFMIASLVSSITTSFTKRKTVFTSFLGADFYDNVTCSFLIDYFWYSVTCKFVTF